MDLNNDNKKEDKPLRTCQVYHQPDKKDQNSALKIFLVILLFSVIILLIIHLI